MLALLAVATALTLTIGAPWVILLSGTAIPWLTETVTNDLAPGWLKVALLAVLSAAAGVVATGVGHDWTFNLATTLYTIALTAIVTFVSHYGFSVSGALPAYNKATANFGIGPRTAGLGPTTSLVLPSDGPYHLVGPQRAVEAVSVVRAAPGTPGAPGGPAGTPAG
jgi:hypothetical protein